MLNQSYIGQRHDIASLVPSDANMILDVGCSVGSLGALLKSAESNRQVIGIELDEKMADLARQQLDEVHCANLSDFNWQRLSDKHLDCVIFADVLEHLVAPELAVQEAAQLMKKGTVIVSVPNARHFLVWFNVFILGKWPMRERGVFDKTHLRWFTLDVIYNMLDQAGLCTVVVERNYRLRDRPGRINERFATTFGGFLNRIPILREWLCYQYVVVARK